MSERFKRDLNVGPVSSKNDVTDRSVRYAKLAAQCAEVDFSRRIATPEIADILFGQLRASMLAAALHALRVKPSDVSITAGHAVRIGPALVAVASRYLASFYGIARVVCSGAQAKMTWIDAQFVVAIGAVVQDHKSFWDRSMRQFPRQPMAEVLTTGQPAATIAASQSVSGPNPAASGTVSARPKPLDARSDNLGTHREPPTVLGAKPRSVSALPRLLLAHYNRSCATALI